MASSHIRVAPTLTSTEGFSASAMTVGPFASFRSSLDDAVLHSGHAQEVWAALCPVHESPASCGDASRTQPWSR